MGNPTNLEPRYVPRTGRDVWARPNPVGYLESIQSAGSVAAPLLAGASFTLVALVLQSTTPFGRWQDLALFLLVAAGLAQIFAVQSVIWTRRYMASPDELKQWYPDDFTHDRERPTQWLLNVQRDNDQNARKWANRTRGWINAGISLLLGGIAVGVVPPGHISPMRWAVVAVAWIGVTVEASWVIGTLVDDRSRRGMMLCTAAIIASGGSTAAAGFAATAGTADGAPATWLAVALAGMAIPLWLVALTGAQYSHGRVRLNLPLTGSWAKAQAALALLAPAIFTLALWSAIRQLAMDRQQMLSSMHPGTERLLPKSVSIQAHHRAWSQCTALPVTSREELAKLLHESSADLGQAGQPRLEDLWERVAYSPGCVVKVADRCDAGTQFGYYIVYPLLAETVRRIRSGQITADRQLQAADLTASQEAGAGWYISVVWTPGSKWARRCVIATLVDALATGGAGSVARPVFARSATDQGRSLMERYGFAAIGAHATGIWALEK
jgi:hypothetical protein